MRLMNPEKQRLSGSVHDRLRWHKWGPYLSDRAWGTVREDYSATGEAWSFLPHDMARSKAFRWGEDGIGGFCDRYQILCWSMAFWNERDPILKERYFGLNPYEANHGEDVKECYFYLDAVPSHAWQRMLYKYPQRAYPYTQLLEENGRRGPNDPEFELIDTGIFDDGRYFDIFIDVVKEDPDTLLFRVTAHNRGPDRAPLHLIPQLWFRNVWSWTEERPAAPLIRATDRGLLADDSAAPPLAGLLADTRLGPHLLELPSGMETLFTDNETNAPRVFGSWAKSLTPYTKDAFHRFIVDGEKDAVNPARSGTKACGWLRTEIDPGGEFSIVMRLGPADNRQPTTDNARQRIFLQRRKEADDFYAEIHPDKASVDERRVQRQAFAGLLWGKQSYLYDVDVWLDGDDPRWPPPASRLSGRNRRWHHLNSMRVMTMPDKWEYPWFAAWDLAFQAVVFALIDAHFAKEQLWLLLFEQFQHPSGQLPAYEWEFSDLNPPVHAWAVWRVYNMDRIRSGKADRAFLEKCFHKLMLNFTWWVNKVDREGNNVFEGGFLGLDNVAVLDRSQPLPGGAVLEQSDGTGWMGMFCLNMMRIALELAKEDAVYEGLATKFFEHYVYIGAAMKMLRGGRTLWDDEDGFFYDLLRFPDGRCVPFRVRSLVGLIPLYAIERLEEKWIAGFDVFRENMRWFLENRRDIVDRCVTTVHFDHDVTHVLAVVDRTQVQQLLRCVFDSEEFLSPFGIRSLSKVHQEHPFTFGNSTVRYEPAESNERLKGGNSNWRGPVWFPTTFLIIETLRKLEKAFGGDVKIAIAPGEAMPREMTPALADTRATEGIGGGVMSATTPSGGEVHPLSLSGLAAHLADRQIHLFLPDTDGYRPIYGPRGTRKAELFAHDPHWKDLIWFNEYFNGDTGEGLGASHQTGWTALVASLIDEWRR